MPARDLTTVATARTVHEADIICGVLRSGGVPAHVSGAQAGLMLPHMGVAVHPRGVPVMVLPEHAQRARKVLAEASETGQAGRPLAERDSLDPAPGDQGPVSEAELLARRAYVCAWLSYIVIIFGPLAVWYGIRATRADAEGRSRGFWLRLGLILLVSIPYWLTVGLLVFGAL
jgi:hypothetical protein